MIITFNRLKDPAQNGIDDRINKQFVTTRDDLKKRLIETAKLSENRSHVKDLTAITGKLCPRRMLSPELASPLRKIQFAFKGATDPAGLYPLRALLVSGEQNATYRIGCETEYNDVRLEQTGLDLRTFSEITELRTYYCLARKTEGSKQTRYGTRLIAFLVTGRSQQNQPSYVYISAGRGFLSAGALQQAAAGADPAGIEGAVDQAVRTFNGQRNNEYVIGSTVNDSGLLLSNADGIGNQVTNIRYGNFIGKSRSYIDNFSLVSMVDIKQTIDKMFDCAEQLEFLIPYKPNPAGLEMSCTFGHGESRKNGTIDIYQKAVQHKFSLPRIGIPDVIDIGSVYAYTATTTRSQQAEAARTLETSDSVTLTVPVKSFVANSFPATPLDNAVTTVRFSYLSGAYGVAVIANTAQQAQVASYRILRKDTTISFETANSGPITVAGIGNQIDGDLYQAGIGGPDAPSNYKAMPDSFQVPKKDGFLFNVKVTGQDCSCVYQFSYSAAAEEIVFTQKSNVNMEPACEYYSANSYATVSRYSVTIPMDTPAFVVPGVSANLDQADDPLLIAKTVTGFL